MEQKKRKLTKWQLEQQKLQNEHIKLQNIRRKIKAIIGLLKDVLKEEK